MGEGVLKPETQKQRLASLRSVVNGDAVTEPDETFFVNVANVIGATVRQRSKRTPSCARNCSPPARLHCFPTRVRAF